MQKHFKVKNMLKYFRRREKEQSISSEVQLSNLTNTQGLITPEVSPINKENNLHFRAREESSQFGIVSTSANCSGELGQCKGNVVSQQLAVESSTSSISRSESSDVGGSLETEKEKFPGGGHTEMHQL